MTEREKQLGLAVLLLVALWGGKSLWGRVSNSLQATSRQVAQAEQEVADLKLQLARSKQTGERLSEWQERSLPLNTQVAAAMYQDWLLGKLDRARLQVEAIEPDPYVGRSDAYQAIGFTVRAQGTLMQVTGFLVAFYESQPMHKITRLHLAPIEDSKDLDVTLRIEALSIQGTASEGVPSGKAKPLALGRKIDYLKAIVNRDLFSLKEEVEEEEVEQEEPEPTQPVEDQLQFALVSAVVPTGTDYQVWITLEKTREVLRLFPGESFQIGPTSGEVKLIEPTAAVLAFEEKEHRILVGRHLRQGRVLEIEGASADPNPDAAPDETAGPKEPESPQPNEDEEILETEDQQSAAVVPTQSNQGASS